MANRIIEAARNGERDVKHLRDAAFGRRVLRQISPSVGGLVRNGKRHQLNCLRDELVATVKL